MPTQTLWQLLEERCAASPERSMLLDERDRRVSFGECLARAERVAAGLFALGIRAGTPVTWQLPTRIETVLLSLALARLGAVQNPILPIYREREVGAVLELTGARWLVVPGHFRGFDHLALAQLLCERAGGGFEILPADAGLPEADPATLPPPPEDANAVRWLYTTSGTTAAPKCVRHSDATLIAGGTGLAVALDARPDDVGTICFPYTHIGGPDYLVMLLLRGMSAVLLESFVPEQAVAVFRRHGVTMSGGSTAFYQAFLGEQRKQPGTPILPSLRLLAGGGAPKPPELFHQVRRELGIPIVHGYGMTECPMIANGTPADTDEQLANSDGRPVVGCELRVVEGEIRVRGPMLCLGYTDPALTAEAFDAEGFFRTGDLGHLRADGHLVLTGRSKELILRKGENLSPREIEDLIATHPSVAAVAVIGLPDAERGERVCAVVETRTGAAPLDFAGLQAHCRAAGLMAQKIPEQLEVVDALPRNATLKILKHELRARFGAWEGPMSSWKRSEVEEAWRHFVAVGDSGDWNAWADLHSADGVWIEHHLGVFRGREAIRKAILDVMKPVPMMTFPVAWHVIEANRVVYYPWQVMPDPKGGDAVYRFGCVTILEYAGGGLWSLQEDLYNPKEAEAVMKRWMAAGGRFAA